MATIITLSRVRTGICFPQRGVRALHEAAQKKARSFKSISAPDVALAVDQTNSRGRVPEAIWARVGSGLHVRRGHPLCTLRSAVQSYFEASAPGEFAFHNDLPPVVSVHDCFDSLLVPPGHVSRAPSDTYYVDDNRVLRAHMTAHDVQLLRRGLRAFVNCGDVYRRDTVDRTHYPVFHQIDGLRLFVPGASDDEIVEDLREKLGGLARHLFGEYCELRWVDAYFPFTGPSFELEVRWQGEWLELLGCGQVQRQVLTNGRVADDVSGWAFGLGLERLAMVLFSIPDIRLFWSEDSRFLSQFENEKLTSTYKPFSVYPEVKKDVSFWVNDPELFHVNDVHELAREVAGDVVENVEIVDTYAKDGRESLCFRVTFRSMEQSLTHEEVNALFSELRERITQSLPVELR